MERKETLREVLYLARLLLGVLPEEEGFARQLAGRILAAAERGAGRAPRNQNLDGKKP